MSTAAALTLPDWLSSTLASDATDGTGSLDPSITARTPTARAAGPALVVLLARDDNAAMRDVTAAVEQSGTVLLAAGGGYSRTAVLGDLVARELLAAGVTAVVTDAPIRDAAAVAELGLAVWSRGISQTASRKQAPGQVGGTVSLGGVVARDGDLVVADADGVVVWPRGEVPALLERAERKQAADEARLARLPDAASG